MIRDIFNASVSKLIDKDVRMLSRYSSTFFLTFISCFLININLAAFSTNNLPQTEKANIIEFCTTRTPVVGILKPELMEKFKSIFKTPVFVESGTFLGATTSEAAKIFDQVYTIELSQDLAKQAQELFKNTKNVKVYQGDSGKVIATLLPNISERIFFYLDGHYSEYQTAQGSTNTPVLAEIAAIRDAKKSDSVIIVDDIRCFQKSRFPEKIQNTCWEGYPDLAQLVNALLEINPNYQICFLGDALLAYPKDPSVKISPVAEACAIHRLSSAFPIFSEKELKEADYTIAHAQGSERDEIFAYWRTFSPSELEKGVSSYGTLWAGMILEREGKKDEAIALYKQSVLNSPTNWRAPVILQAAVIP